MCGLLKTPKLTPVFNPLPNDKTLDPSKMKKSADEKLKAIQLAKFVLDKTENIGGKRGKCWLPSFSSFSPMFSNGFFFRVVKSRDRVVKS